MLEVFLLKVFDHIFDVSVNGSSVLDILQAWNYIENILELC